jgi:hypothetical protein
MRRLPYLTALLVSIAAPALSFAGGDGARKSGEWEITVTVSGQSPNTSKYCIDAASDDIAAMAGGGVAQTGCSESQTGIAGGTIKLHSVCQQGNSTVTASGLLSGDLQSAYRGEIVKNYSPPLYGRTEVKSTVEGRYLGGCS